MRTPMNPCTIPWTLLLVLVGSTAAIAAETKTSNGGMTYSIQVPDSYDAAGGATLVLGLHGRGDNHRNFMAGMESASFLKDCILVAADALTDAQWGEADIPVLAQLVQELGRSHNLNRTIVYGFSMGAYCSFTFSTRHPELVQGVIPHSGGIAFPIAKKEGLDALAFYVIHGDADSIVPVSQSRSAVDKLKEAGITRVEYEEVPGLAHTVSSAASERAFAWIEKTLGPAVAPLADEKAAELLDAAEDAVKAEDWEAAREALEPLGGASKRFGKKIASLAKKCVDGPDEPLALVAIAVCGRLGALGLGALKVVPDDDEARAVAATDALMRTRSPKALKPLSSYLGGDSEPVAVAAAAALASFGGKDATVILVKALKSAEKSEARADRRQAILTALQQLYGVSNDTAKDWTRWLDQHG